MKIPTYERQTSRITPEVSTPHPLRPPAAAFGTESAEALQNLGEAGQKIASLMTQRAQERQKELMLRDNMNKDTAFGQMLFDIQYNDKTDENGRPKGLLNRKLEQAQGITEEFNQTYFKLRKQILESTPDIEQQNVLAKMIDSRFETVQNRIANHERQETDKSIGLAHKSSLDLQENEAAQIRDNSSLSAAIDKAVATQESFNRFMGYDPDTAKVNNGEAATKIVKSSILSTLKTTGNLTQAQALLDSVKDRLPGNEKYNEIKDEIIKGYDGMQSQAEKIQLENKIAARFDYIGQIANGTLPWENSAETIKTVATKDPELAEAMKKVFEAKGRYAVEDFDNEGFQNLAKDIFKAKDTETISKFLLQALKDNKNISRDRLAILVDAARERSKELPLSVKGQKAASPKRSFWDSAWDAIMLSNPLTAPFVLMNTINRTKAENAQGEQIVNIANDEIRKQRIKDNPVISTLPAKGRLLIDRYGNKAIVYPDGSYEEVMSKTGEFKHKEQRKRQQPEEKQAEEK
ncbi:MAG: hypothetical protein WC357_02860 [Candidatus Omnitrophota bacterium]|jgi:hypothetical protein